MIKESGSNCREQEVQLLVLVARRYSRCCCSAVVVSEEELMGTIIGAKTCTWQQLAAAATKTTTRLNLSSRRVLSPSPPFLCLEQEQKSPSFPRLLCPLAAIDCDARGQRCTLLHSRRGSNCYCCHCCYWPKEGIRGDN